MKARTPLFNVLLIISLLLNVIAIPLYTSQALAAEPAAAVDFEAGAPAGFFVYNGGASSVTTNTQVVAAGDALARPGQVGNNTVLTTNFTLGDFGGFGVDYAAAGGPQDWSTYTGFSFWFHGSNSGLTYQVDVFDNRSNPASDTAERFAYQFADNASGWRLIKVPFSALFRRSDFQPGGAPNDGLTLTEMWGWATVLPNTGGTPRTFSMDDFGLISNIVDDFESGLPSGVDANGIPVGFYMFNGAGSSVSISTSAAAPILPALGTPNQVLQVNVDVTSYAGMIHGFQNAANNTWVTQDWSAYEGFAFWLYGNNSGADLFIDLLDNRAPDSTRDDAERWTVAFKDNFSGWKYFQMPFSSFVRKEIGNGAPNDGLTLTAVTGWAFGTLATGGPRTYYIDQVNVYGSAPFRPLEVTFSTGNPRAAEGTTATVVVKLNRPMGEDDPAQVTVQYSLEPGSAVVDRNYTTVPGGTLTFTNGGPSEQSFTIPTLHDFKHRGDLTVVLRLSNPVDVNIGAIREAALSVVDIDPLDASLLDDFELGTYLFNTEGFGLSLETPEIAAGDALALPGQQGYEHILSLNTPIPVTISIRPGSHDRGLCVGKDPLRIAILSTPSFDATQVDGQSVRFGQASPKDVKIQDVNHDHRRDMLLRFDFGETGYSCNATDTVLTGELNNGQPIIAGGKASVGRDFVIPQDWSSAEGLSFWWYGQNSGDAFKATIDDNRAADTGPTAWNLAWSDEFSAPSGTSPDSNIWTAEIGDGLIVNNPGWGNSELEYYTDSTDNVATDGNGNLVITTKESDGSLECYYGPCQFTSARLTTANKLEFGYGRAEARIKVPAGTGIWPAFWSLGNDISNVGWPQSGEIDIMEVVGRLPHTAFGTIHGPGYSGGSGFGNTYNLPSGNFADAYHTFSIEWQPNQIRWYVDGILYHTATPADVAPDEWVFDHPFYLMLNTAIGGNFGGPVGEDAVFPQAMQVDYVRIYQAADSAERFEAPFTDNFNGWQKLTIPFTSFTRSSSQPAGAPSDGLGLSEVWGYGIELPGGTQNGNIKLDQVRLAAATHITVTNTNNAGPGSLRDAIARVASGGTITFAPALANQTITLTSGVLTLSKNVNIDGSAAPGLVVSGNNADRVFIINAGIVADVSNLIIANGYGFDLAGAILNNGTLNLESSTVRDSLVGASANDYWKGGGGIYNGQDSVLNLTNSTVSNNSTQMVDGGGVYAFFNAAVTIRNSTISGNTAAGVGGAMRSLGNVNIINSTLSGNTAQAWYGGAIFHTDGVMQIVNSTISGNVAPPWADAAIFVGTFTPANASLSLTNSIVAGNTSTGCFAGFFGGGTVTLASGGDSLFSDATCNPVASDIVTAATGLGTFGNHGGPTQTYALLAGSPAIDAANDALCPAEDQRGVARPQGAACDIGSYEFP